MVSSIRLPKHEASTDARRPPSQARSRPSGEPHLGDHLLCGRAKPPAPRSVSNFSIKNLELLLQTAKIVPVVNQVRAHSVSALTPS